MKYFVCNPDNPLRKIQLGDSKADAVTFCQENDFNQLFEYLGTGGVREIGIDNTYEFFTILVTTSQNRKLLLDIPDELAEKIEEVIKNTNLDDCLEPVFSRENRGAHN